MEDFYFRILTADDEKEVRSYLYLFLEKDVAVQCLSFTADDKKLVVETYVKDLLYEEISLGVFERVTGEMCGCLLVEDGQSTVYRETYAKHGMVSERLAKLMRFDQALEKGVDEKAAGRTFWTLDVMIVGSKHLRKGLASYLVSRVEDLALKHNIDLLFGAATSNISLRVFLKNRFVPVKEMLYADYKDPLTEECIFKDVQPPHTGSVLTFKEMRQIV